MFYCYYPFNSFASSLLHPSAYVGCWWDLRRDPSFSYLRIILVLGVFQGLCGVWIIISGAHREGISKDFVTAGFSYSEAFFTKNY
jgi:heme A synthase